MRWRSLGLAQVQKGVLILIKFLSFWKRRETSLIARAQSTSIPLLHSGNKNATILVPNSAAGETEFLFQNKRLNEIFRANKNIKMAVPSNFLKQYISRSFIISLCKQLRRCPEDTSPSVPVSSRPGLFADNGSPAGAKPRQHRCEKEHGRQNKGSKIPCQITFLLNYCSGLCARHEVGKQLGKDKNIFKDQVLTVAWPSEHTSPSGYLLTLETTGFPKRIALVTCGMRYGMTSPRVSISRSVRETRSQQSQEGQREETRGRIPQNNPPCRLLTMTKVIDSWAIFLRKHDRFGELRQNSQ